MNTKELFWNTRVNPITMQIDYSKITAELTVSERKKRNRRRTDKLKDL
jgi:hypothetical protein